MLLATGHGCRQVGRLGSMAHEVDRNPIACAPELTVTPLPDARIVLTRPAVGDEVTRGLLVACVILILCWLCGTLLRVWRVMPFSGEPLSE
jgi:hypothetical protein